MSFPPFSPNENPNFFPRSLIFGSSVQRMFESLSREWLAKIRRHFAWLACIVEALIGRLPRGLPYAMFAGGLADIFRYQPFKPVIMFFRLRLTSLETFLVARSYTLGLLPRPLRLSTVTIFLNVFIIPWNFVLQIDWLWLYNLSSCCR